MMIQGGCGEDVVEIHLLKLTKKLKPPCSLKLADSCVMNKEWRKILINSYDNQQIRKNIQRLYDYIYEDGALNYFQRYECEVSPERIETQFLEDNHIYKSMRVVFEHLEKTVGTIKKIYWIE